MLKDFRNSLMNICSCIDWEGMDNTQIKRLEEDIDNMLECCRIAKKSLDKDVEAYMKAIKEEMWERLNG